MEKKNKKMLMLVSVLLLLGGISFAYFVGTSLFKGTGSRTEGITASINGATVNVVGGLAFNDLDILPGHQTISSIKVTATGNNELIPYNLIWNGTNSLNTPLEFKVYKTSKEVDVSVTCDKKTKVENGYQILNEECTISNIDKLGEVISSGIIETETSITKVILAEEEFITATSDGDTKYYYVILEYPNLDEEQNADMGGTFQGTVTVEESNAKPDINILAVKIEQEDGTYQDSDDIPQDWHYALNKEKSTCSNDAVPLYDTNTKIFTANNLTKKGTSCYLYFYKPTAATVLSSLGIVPNEETPDFSQIATTDEGVYKVKDESGKDSYYFRGAVENNYVRFAGQIWRIVRINSDGSIRIILNTNAGTSYFSSGYEDNMYVGFKYTSGETQGTGTESTILNKLNSWYKTNIEDKGYSSKIDPNAGFCGDRRRTSGLGTGKSNTYYASYTRLIDNKAPELSCEDADFYTVRSSSKGNKSLTYPVGLITADEVAMAGGAYNTDNVSYYLYTGANFWTMTPHSYSSYYNYSYVWYSGDSSPGGSKLLHNLTSSSNYGMRPVINLKSSTIFTGTGTALDPYIVVEGN